MQFLFICIFLIMQSLLLIGMELEDVELLQELKKRVGMKV